MPIAFFNIRSKETVIAETEPQISALWASSDHSPNITQGQDFGWRLAPAIVVEMKRIKQDFSALQEIASRQNISTEDVDEKAILLHISARARDDSETPVASDADYTDDYNDEIRRLQAKADAGKEAPTTTTTTTKSR